MLAFGSGMYVAATKSFPYGMVRAGVEAGRNLVRVQPTDFILTPVPADSVSARRVQLVGARTLAEPVIMTGGSLRFRELCPQTGGCLAVRIAEAGSVVHAWPILAQDADAIVADVRQEQTLGADGRNRISVFYATPFPNGDLLVTYFCNDLHSNSFPCGIARIDKNGRLLWYRNDGSHHEPYVGTADTIWVADSVRTDVDVEQRGVFAEAVRNCNDAAMMLDAVSVLDGDGALVKRFSLWDAFAGSPWWVIARQRISRCIGTHLNAVAAVGEDVSGLDGVEHGDIVLSLRNWNAFLVMDRETGSLHRLVRGTFRRQHSVKHLGGSKFILFDNRGYVPSWGGVGGMMDAIPARIRESSWWIRRPARRRQCFRAI